MTATRIKDVIGPVLEKIKKLSPDKDTSNILVYVESQLAFEKLINFLNKYAQSDQGIYIVNLRPLCDFLSERWYRIKNTDAIYSHHPMTIANQAYLILADALAAILNERSFNLLMPTVGAIMHQTSRENLNSFKFQEFVLGDDGTPIEIAKCLNDAFKNKTYQLFSTGTFKKLLSYWEKERVIHHSTWATIYYEAIVRYVKGQSTLPEKENENFNQAILKNDYIITSTYGEQGQSRLAEHILATTYSQREFVNAMSKFVPRNQWKEFISDLPTEDLITIILDNDSLINSVRKRRSYVGEENYDRAMLFCFVEVYWRRRAKGDRFSSFVGQLADYTNGVLGGFTREQKEEAVNLLQDFLMSNENFTRLYEYVRKHAKKPESWHAIYELGSNLAVIAEQIKNVAAHEFIKEKKPGLFNIISLSS